MLPALANRFQLKLHWNFFATSHGKGPNDALGGTVKRIAHRMIMTRTTTVTDDDSFAAAVRPHTRAKVIVVNEDMITAVCDDLGVGKIWRTSQTFHGIINVHFVEATDEEIVVKFYATASESTHLAIKQVRELDTVPRPIDPEPVTRIDPEPDNTAHLNVDTAGHCPSRAQPCTSGVKTRGRTRQSKANKNMPANCFANFYCIYCNELFIHPPFEDWIQCDECKMWPHKETDCVGSGRFVCYECRP